MFLQQKKLSFLNLPSKRVKRLFVSTVNEQIAFSDYPSQMATAYLAALYSANGVQVVLAFHLVESRKSLFFLPQAGEVVPNKVDAIMHEGMDFVESMGFVMTDSDIHQLSPDQMETYWRDLPICKITEAPTVMKKTDSSQAENQQATSQNEDNQGIKQEEKEQTARNVAIDAVEKLQTPLTETIEGSTADQSVRTEPKVSLEQRMERCKESLGRFLASF